MAMITLNSRIRQIYPQQGSTGLGEVSHSGESGGTMDTMGSLYVKEKELPGEGGES